MERNRVMIKLTNAAEEHKGKVLLINSEHIMTVFETKIGRAHV